MANNKEDCCSFCKRPGFTPETGPLIKGYDGVMICRRCVETCHQIFQDQDEKRNPAGQNDGLAELKSRPLPKPAEIKAELDKYVVGQEQAGKECGVGIRLRGGGEGRRLPADGGQGRDRRERFHRIICSAARQSQAEQQDEHGEPFHGGPPFADESEGRMCASAPFAMLG